MFSDTCFDHLLDLQFWHFLGNLVHIILLHEVETVGADQELWFLITGTYTQLSHMEFALITGLTFGPYADIKVKGTRLKD